MKARENVYTALKRKSVDFNVVELHNRNLKWRFQTMNTLDIVNLYAYFMPRQKLF